MSIARWQRIVQHAAAGNSSARHGERKSVFLYSGTCHDRVPRALLSDKRLTPLERNAWLVIRMLANTPDAAPGEGELQHFLSTTPGGACASRETVARVLSILRLSRWLSLVSRGRDAQTGQLQKAVYVLHEQALSPNQALALDPHYFELVGSSQRHASRAIRLVAGQIFEELEQNPDIDTARLPKPPAHRQGHVDRRAIPALDSEPGALPRFGTTQRQVRNRAAFRSQSESSQKSRTYHAVRNPDSPSTVPTYTDTYVGTIPREPEDAAPGLCLGELEVLQLTPGQQRSVTRELISLPPAQRQAVLDEAAARCRTGSVREPAAYLTALIQRAKRGEFKPWAAAGERTSAPPAKPPERPRPPQPKRQPGDPVSAQVQVCLDEIRQHSRFGRA